MPLAALYGYHSMHEALREAGPGAGDGTLRVLRLVLAVTVPVAVAAGLWRGRRPLDVIDDGSGRAGYGIGLAALAATVAAAPGPVASARIDAAGVVFCTLLSTFGYAVFATRGVTRLLRRRAKAA